MKKKLLSLFVAACCSVTIFGGNILPLDWDNIPSEYLYSITNPANAKYKALTKMKAACDNQYLYIWAEFDTKYLDTNEYQEEFGLEYVGSTPFHVFLNDGKHKGHIGLWSESTPAAIMMEGFLFKSDKPINYNPSTFQWPDYEESSVGWPWEECSIQPIVESVVTTSTVELAISLASLPLTFDQYTYIGIVIYKDWYTEGLLPYQTLDGEGYVITQEMAKVKISPNLLSGTFINHLAYDFDSKTKTATVIGCDSGLTNITIPETITYQEQTYSVTTIEVYAFYDCTSLTSVTIGNSVTTIGESAFENCNYLKTVTLGKSLTDIGCNAFKGDYRVEEITSYAEVTPNVCSTTFDGLSKQYIYLYVPENSVRAYQVDPNWNGFDIRTKSADKKPIDGDNPIVTPSDQDVTITWPITNGTDTYTLTITKNGEIVCVLTFNANGQLTNIAFAAPVHDGSRQAPTATLTAQGYQFTVTGLTPGTAYDYSVTAIDAGGKTIAEHKGNFSTTSGTGLESVHDSQCTMHKYLHNGQLIINRNGEKYSAMGERIR